MNSLKSTNTHTNVCAKSLQLCLTLGDPMDCSPSGSSVHGMFQALNAGVGCHALLQGIFLTQGWNPGFLPLLCWQRGSLPLVPPGKPTYKYIKDTWPSILDSVRAQSLQQCLTLCNPMDCSPPGSSVHGILQGGTLEGVAIAFSGGSSQPRDQTHISRVSCIAGGFFTTESLGKPLSQMVICTLKRFVTSSVHRSFSFQYFKN